jgi:hypothetical protein
MPANQPSPVAPYGNWVSYAGGDAVLLAIVLIVLAAAFAYVGTRLRNPIGVQRPGATAGSLMIVIWLLAIATFVVALVVCAMQLKQAYPTFKPPKARVGTLVDAVVTFFVILYLTKGYGWRVALGSAVVGTASAPMIFELPFDLIVMARTYPPIPPNPTLFRALFFLPLFIVELSTISLLTLLPSMRITKPALYALAGMFLVFAVWAAFGFSFPAAPLPKTLNVISKILCFVTAIMLFVWRSPQSARHEMH